MKKISVAFALLLTSLTCFAEESATQLLAILTPLQTMQADFQQSILDKNGRVLEQTSGKMALLRPGKFSWDTQKPTHQLLMADGTKIWLYDESLKQVTVQPQTKKAASPVMLLSDPTSNLIAQFSVCCAKKTQDQFMFTLTPKDKTAMFQRAELSFKAGQLSQMQLFDNLGQRTMIKFSQVKTNAPLNPSVFAFVTPKGTDVVVGQ